MTQSRIGLLAAALAIVSITGLGISSCDSNSNAPVTPGNNGSVDRNKSPQVTDGPCNVSVGISNCPIGLVAAGYNTEGDEVFTGVAATAGVTNGIDCNFASPINVWRAAILATFPSIGGSLRYESKDTRGTVEARVDLEEQGGRYKVYPTFTSSQGAGTPQYDVAIYNNGTQVATQSGLNASTDVVWILPSPQCTLSVHSAGWDVYQVNAQCAWKLGFDPCCTYSFQLPNGLVILGNQIRLIERNSTGVYVYLQTNKITTTGNVATYNIKAASAYLHN